MDNKIYFSDLPKPKFETRADELNSAINMLSLLLTYHRRVSMTISDEQSALRLYSYEMALETAISSLQRELSQL